MKVALNVHVNYLWGAPKFYSPRARVHAISLQGGVSRPAETVPRRTVDVGSGTFSYCKLIIPVLRFLFIVASPNGIRSEVPETCRRLSPDNVGKPGTGRRPTPILTLPTDKRVSINYRDVFLRKTVGGEKHCAHVSSWKKRLNAFRDGSTGWRGPERNSGLGTTYFEYSMYSWLSLTTNWSG